GDHELDALRRKLQGSAVVQVDQMGAREALDSPSNRRTGLRFFSNRRDRPLGLFSYPLEKCRGRCSY
ncbi:MAG: hypothetical protein OXI06_06170, partial [bacterium]|nr:hypothetical protein [bacterium]